MLEKTLETPSMGFSRQEYWSGVPLPSPISQHPEVRLEVREPLPDHAGESPLLWRQGPCSPRDSQESSPTPQFKSINSSSLSFLHSPTLTSIHDHRKNHSLPRSKWLLLSWLQSPSAVTLEPRKIKSDTVSTVSPTPWTVAHQAPLSLRFSRQEYWSGSNCCFLTCIQVTLQ